MQTASEAKFQVLKLKQLPALSPTAARLLEMLNDESLSLSALSRTISQDPAITARILGVANSAYFGQTKPIHTVEEAVIRVLGLNMVKSLAFSIAISGSFNTSACHGFDLEAYWYRSLATGILSKMICGSLAEEMRPDPDAIYLAGLLFDIGILVLVHLFPQDYAQVVRRVREQPQQDLPSLEQELVGISSREAGAWLMDRWHLPVLTVQVLAQLPATESKTEIALVRLAADWVRSPVVDLSGKDLAAGAGLLGLSATQLQTIHTEYLHKGDEIRSIASMLGS